MSQSHKNTHTKLGEFFSTAICGNDILSSALYVSGIAALFAGVYAPLVLLCIGGVLFLYKSVYREVVEALPVNGGAYNALLNGTSKTVAAIAGVMTVLSYVATAVISAKTGVEYFIKFTAQLLEFFHIGSLAHTIELLVIPIIIVVLFAFALLVASGVKDSAKVAFGIFIFHIITLCVFVGIGLFLFINNQSLFIENLAKTQSIVSQHGGLLKTLFLAFSASLLGVSGFESSANFVEEQDKGVFKKTLRNMLIGVTIFNPFIALVTLNILPLSEIALAKDFLLAEAAFSAGGLFLAGWIAVDAFLVLCGAVLTSYVGVSGLVNRMTLDDCLPSVLLGKKENSNTRIIMAFFLLCTSILLITKGDLLSLAGVYTISFLGVMSLFALGNVILRQTRTELKRPYQAPFPFVIGAFIATAAGIIGNILIDPRNALFFLIYFVPAVLIVLGNIYKKDFLLTLIAISQIIPGLNKKFRNMYDKTVKQRFYVFIHHTDRLYSALDYISRNENGWNITFIHCKGADEKDTRYEIEDIMPTLKKAGVFPHFNLEFEYAREVFSPEFVMSYARSNRIPRNRIFIGSIHHHHDFDYEDFGGVRIIF